MSTLSSKELAELVVDALEDMKGQSIRSINVEELTAITDYMVIVTGTSSTHISALSDAVTRKAKEVGQSVSGVEGQMQAEWVLVDLGGVVVHIMLAPIRALYNLEDLWAFKISQASDSGADSGGDEQESADGQQ